LLAIGGVHRLLYLVENHRRVIDAFRNMPERLRKPARRLLEALASDEKTSSA